MTIDEILKRSTELEKKKNEKINIELNGNKFIFNKIDIATFNDIKETKGNKDSKMLYYCSVSPNMKDSDLIEKLGCKSDPTLVPTKFLTESEILEISNIILDRSDILPKGLAIVTIGD
ncbi:MAG: hypothetical protein ACRCXY_00795 [Fusobacteriaceae bacterium]